MSAAPARQVKLLLDENLAPAVAETLRIEGVDAAHVRERSLSGKSDRVVLERAFREDRILVTANVTDFERLAAARELHAGIVLILDGNLLRDEQFAVLSSAIEIVQREYGAGRDLVNRILRGGGQAQWKFDQLGASPSRTRRRI